MLPLFFSGSGVYKPELRDTSFGGSGTGITSQIVNKPLLAQTGDLALCWITLNLGTSTVIPAAGWTLVPGSNVSISAPFGQSAALFSRTIQAGDPASWTFTCTAATEWAYGVVAYLNASGIDVSATANSSVFNNSPVTVSFPSVTPTLANEAVVLFAALDPTLASIATTWTPPPQFIPRLKVDWGAIANGHIWIADNIKTGATGVMNANVVTSANSIGWITLSVALTTKVVSGVTGTYSGSQSQTFSANGTATPPLVSGNFTGSQQQTFSANGTFTPQAINGTFAGSQQQTFSATGTFTPSGITGAYAGSQVQSFNASGTFSNPAITGAYSGSQVQTFSASGAAVPPAITGSFTGSQRQTFTADGTFTPAGISGAYTGSQRQTFSATGAAIPPAISGTYSGSQQQTFNASGGAISPVTGAYTGSQVQSFSGSGGAVVPVTGTYTGGQTQTFTGIGQHGSTEQPSGGGQNASGNTKRDETPFLIAMPRPLRRAISKKESKQSLTKNIESVIELARDKQRNDLLTEVQAIEFAADALKVLLMQAQIEWESSYQLWLKHQVQLRLAGEDDECFYLMAMMA